jgi:dihydroxyacetone kinase-like predicted kinase
VVYDPDADLEPNLKAMGDAASKVRAGEVTQAVRDSGAECGTINRGDWIAITDTGIVAVAGSALDAAIALVEHLVDGDSELVTVLLGADARPGDTDRLRDHLGLNHPEVEVEVHAGNQPLYPYLLGVE